MRRVWAMAALAAALGLSIVAMPAEAQRSGGGSGGGYRGGGGSGGGYRGAPPSGGSYRGAPHGGNFRGAPPARWHGGWHSGWRGGAWVGPWRPWGPAWGGWGWSSRAWGGWGWGVGWNPWWGWGPGTWGWSAGVPIVIAQPSSGAWVLPPSASPVYVERNFEAAPIPAPTPPAEAPQQWWYWCNSANAYYPYVNSCPEPWQRVEPRTPPEQP